MKIFRVLQFGAITPSDRIEEVLDMASAEGFELENSFAAGESPVFVMSKKERVRGTTAYPSEKQQTYVEWAYNCLPKEFEQYKVNRSEASTLIGAHKEGDAPGRPYEKGTLGEVLAALRKGKPEEFDDDIPF